MNKAPTRKPVDADVKETFKKQFKKLLKLRGFTRIEFADKSGIPKSTVDKWLSPNGTMPDHDKYYKICEILECETDYLYGLSDVPIREFGDIGKKTGLSYEAVEMLHKFSSQPFQSQFYFQFDDDVKDNSQFSRLRKSFPYAVIEPCILNLFNIRENIFNYIVRPDTPLFKKNVVLSSSNIGAVYTDNNGALKYSCVEIGSSLEKQVLIQNVQESLDKLRSHLIKLHFDADVSETELSKIIAKSLFDCMNNDLQ